MSLSKQAMFHEFLRARRSPSTRCALRVGRAAQGSREPVPATEDDAKQLRVRQAALRSLLERLTKQPVIDIGHWTRDELYDR